MRKPVERLADRLGIARHRRVDRRRIERVVAGHHFQQQRRIFGRARQRADLVEAAGERHQTVAADAAVGRLQPGDAAQAGRLANRAAGVGADRQRRHRRRDAGRGAAAGAAGNARQVPGIARLLEGRVLGRAAHGELVHVRVADQHGVGRLEPLDHRGVVGRREVLEHLRAAGRHFAQPCTANP